MPCVHHANAITLENATTASAAPPDARRSDHARIIPTSITYTQLSMQHGACTLCYCAHRVVPAPMANIIIGIVYGNFRPERKLYAQHVFYSSTTQTARHAGERERERKFRWVEPGAEKMA